jgi:hypothetical protein
MKVMATDKFKTLHLCKYAQLMTLKIQASNLLKHAIMRSSNRITVTIQGCFSQTSENLILVMSWIIAKYMVLFGNECKEEIQLVLHCTWMHNETNLILRKDWWRSDYWYDKEWWKIKIWRMRGQIFFFIHKKSYYIARYVNRQCTVI